MLWLPCLRGFRLSFQTGSELQNAIRQNVIAKMIFCGLAWPGTVLVITFKLVKIRTPCFDLDFSSFWCWVTTSNTSKLLSSSLSPFMTTIWDGKCAKILAWRNFYPKIILKSQLWPCVESAPRQNRTILKRNLFESDDILSRQVNQ